MKQLKIFTVEDAKEEKILRKKSIDVTKKELNDKDFHSLLGDLLHTAQTSEEQVDVESSGISAPQVGINKNIIYIYNFDTDDFELLLNPTVQNIGGKTDIDLEGCLSVPNIEKKVKRFKKVKVSYMDLDGNMKKRRFDGMNARVVQHEYDHLNGILFIDKAID